jgi:eukaryotic-like serine/threonine-protein kinase
LLARAEAACHWEPVQHEPTSLAPAVLPVRAGRLPQAKGRALPHRLGRYTAFDHIGRGGMADIYLARAHTELGASRLVVLKEVLPELAHNARFAEMLVGEAKLAARLSHANVVQVEDLGREDGVLFIAMEYVEGLDLRELLRRCAKGKVALPVEFSLRVVTEVLKALDYAHRHRGAPGSTTIGIVHRDVSPSNVLISLEGEIKLCDFGIARANALVPELPEEAIQGKAGYMSPEHARGDAIDARADVFAAGIILWELLAGHRLYKAEPGERLIDLARRAYVPPLPTRGLPHEDELYAIVACALAPCREDRFPTAAAMRHRLEEYVASARMMASPLRFGEWVSGHFGGGIVERRRARERVIEALARGPVAVIRPILPPPSLDPTPTPSTVMVCERAEPAVDLPAEEPVQFTSPRSLVMEAEGEGAGEVPALHERPWRERGVARLAAYGLLLAAFLLGLLLLAR